MIIKTAVRKGFIFFLAAVFAFSCVSIVAASQSVSAATKLTFPSPTGYVNDFEGILNNDEALEQKLKKLEEETTVEVAIVTTPDFQDTYIEDYAVQLFEAWKIGKSDKDNGLLIIVSKKMREARLEVGYGLEGTLPDSLTKRIQEEYMIPSFKEDDYSSGVDKGVDVVIGLIKEDPTVVSELNDTGSISSFSIEIIMFILFFMASIMGSTKSWWLGGILGLIAGIILGASYFQPMGWLILPLPMALLGLGIDFLLSKTGLVTFSGRSGGFWGGSGSSGGGFGGFGGGSSGGGGSSSSW